MNWHPHLHALVADGLFTSSGAFHVMPKVDLAPLEQHFRVRLIRMLVNEGLLAEEMGRKLLGWRHSGFSIHNGRRSGGTMPKAWSAWRSTSSAAPSTSRT